MAPFCLISTELPFEENLGAVTFQTTSFYGLGFPSATLRRGPRKGLKPSCQTASSGTGPEETWEPGQPGDKGRIVAAH